MMGERNFFITQFPRKFEFAVYFSDFRGNGVGGPPGGPHPGRGTVTSPGARSPSQIGVPPVRELILIRPYQFI